MATIDHVIGGGGETKTKAILDMGTNTTRREEEIRLLYYTLLDSFVSSVHGNIYSFCAHIKAIFRSSLVERYIFLRLLNNWIIDSIKVIWFCIFGNKALCLFFLNCHYLPGTIVEKKIYHKDCSITYLDCKKGHPILRRNCIAKVHYKFHGNIQGT